MAVTWTASICDREATKTPVSITAIAAIAAITAITIIRMMAQAGNFDRLGGGGA